MAAEITREPSCAMPGAQKVMIVAASREAVMDAVLDMFKQNAYAEFITAVRTADDKWASFGRVATRDVVLR